MGSNIRLEKFTKADFSRLKGWIRSEEEMVQFSGPIFTFPITDNQLVDYISVKNRLIYKVIENAGNRVIGHAELNKIDYKNNNARICRVLVGEITDRNKGYGKSIITELIKIGFSQLGLHR